MDFGEALVIVKNGGTVARSGWNGKGLFIYLKKGSVDDSKEHQSYIDGVCSSLFDSGDVGMVTRLPSLCMKTASGSTLEGWLASQTDMLSVDWEVVNN